jgi:hypothetical protein
MDSWPSKKRVRTQPSKSSKEQSNEDLLIATARLSVQLAGQQRADSACLKRVALLPTTITSSTAMVKAGQEWHDNQGNKDTDDASTEKGYPHVYVWQALLLSLRDSTLLAEDEKIQITAHAAQMQEPEMVLDHVTICRAKQTHDGKFVKLTVSTDASLEPLVQTIFKVLKRQGAEVKYGPAPPLSGERTVRNLLRNVSIKNKD